MVSLDLNQSGTSLHLDSLLKKIQCPMNFGKKTIAIGRIPRQRYTYRVLQTIQMELILLCVWAEPGRFGQC